MNTLLTLSPNLKREPFDKAPGYVYLRSFTEDGYRDFKKDFNEAEARDQSIIPIVIDSYGGDVAALFGMIAVIENSRKTVATIVESKAMSCGAILFSMGHKAHRYIAPLGCIMIHQTAGDSWGKLAEVKTSAEYHSKLNDQAFDVLDRRSGHRKGYWRHQLKSIENGELFLDAHQSVAAGLASRVGVPNLRVKVSTEYSLE